ncbi:MAG: DUF1464 family protein [Candidatus Altiarchaeota archaeon]|nr:DUF1464 family protein [Candidatus Altiarchaeota archaeon]
MVTAVGIDPGTKSMDVFGFEDETDEVIMDIAIPRAEVTKNPQIVLDAIFNLDRKIDAIVGPSGYGLPMVKASKASDEQINSATFITKADLERRLNIVGLRELMFLMRGSGLNIWFPPGVIHLPTVPEHRKINRIDMGTADKVFTAVSGIRDQAERYSTGFSQTSFIILEIGFGYTAALAVKDGKIVDGVGGTSGGLGYMGLGGMDGELAYALANTGEFSKTLLFKGGAVSVSGIDSQKLSIEEFISPTKKDSNVELAYSAMLEAIVKDTYLLLPSVRKPKEILLSGRFTRIEPFIEDVRSALKAHGISAGVRTLERKAGEVKEAAEGAAIIANGIAGGRYSKLIENMELLNCSGGVFSHLYLGKEIGERLEDTFTR